LKDAQLVKSLLVGGWRQFFIQKQFVRFDCESPHRDTTIAFILTLGSCLKCKFSEIRELQLGNTYWISQL